MCTHLLQDMPNALQIFNCKFPIRLSFWQFEESSSIPVSKILHILNFSICFRAEEYSFHLDNLHFAGTSSIILFAVMIWQRFWLACFAESRQHFSIDNHSSVCSNNTAHSNFGCMSPCFSCAIFTHTFETTSRNFPFFFSNCLQWFSATAWVANLIFFVMQL